MASYGSGANIVGRRIVYGTGSIGASAKYTVPENRLAILYVFNATASQWSIRRNGSASIVYAIDSKGSSVLTSEANGIMMGPGDQLYSANNVNDSYFLIKEFIPQGEVP